MLFGMAPTTQSEQSTKLKIASLLWTLQKVSLLVKANHVVANAVSSKQTTLTCTSSTIPELEGSRTIALEIYSCKRMLIRA